MPLKPTYEELTRQLEILQTEVAVLRQTAQKYQQAAKKSPKALETKVGERTTPLAATHQVLNREIDPQAPIETALRKSEKQYRTLVDNSLAGIYQTDLDGNMLYANEALIKMFGYDSPQAFMAEGVISTAWFTRMMSIDSKSDVTMSLKQAPPCPC